MVQQLIGKLIASRIGRQQTASGIAEEVLFEQITVDLFSLIVFFYLILNIPNFDKPSISSQKPKSHLLCDKRCISSRKDAKTLPEGGGGSGRPVTFGAICFHSGPVIRNFQNLRYSSIRAIKAHSWSIMDLSVGNVFLVVEKGKL
ncbi:hypothetical protein CEXT_322341 [Caerostris extrusa]|uniref:Uncharacterized protein n=1 Tax=Caerostris extrusa TaxID=172846 RepID=A0AAV4Q0K0_CAEEX|nr:hypothetical protein CEXT_322341 [Caerostris extrusa]